MNIGMRCGKRQVLHVALLADLLDNVLLEAFQPPNGNPIKLLAYKWSACSTLSFHVASYGFIVIVQIVSSAVIGSLQPSLHSAVRLTLDVLADST